MSCEPEHADFTLSEAVSIKRALEPLIRAEAKERQRLSVDSSLFHFRRKAPGAESIRTILLSELRPNILRAANSTKLGH
jgi:hypothetical protein